MLIILLVTEYLEDIQTFILETNVATKSPHFE
jgi:hypothetical protein